jgi:hypothetical protein
MTPICNFVAKKVYGNKALKRTQICDIMKKVKEGKPAVDLRGFKTKRRIRNSAFIADIAAEVESEIRVTIRKLAWVYHVSTRTIQATLRGDLNLSKKSARFFFTQQYRLFSNYSAILQIGMS